MPSPGRPKIPAPTRASCFARGHSAWPRVPWRFTCTASTSYRQIEPVVETADMIDHMLGYKPAHDTDEAGFQRKMQTAIKSLEEASIIKPVPGTTRYIIYGVITAILSAEHVAALDDRYKAIARANVNPGSPGPVISADPDADPGTDLEEIDDADIDPEDDRG